MSISVAARKAKGRGFQQWVCKKISELLNIEWGYEDEKLIQPRLMGQGGADVVLRGEARKRFPYQVECKRTEKWDVPGAVKQAKKYTKEDNWLLFMKRNREDPIVVMDANKFFELMYEIKLGKEVTETYMKGFE